MEVAELQDSVLVSLSGRVDGWAGPASARFGQLSGLRVYFYRLEM